MSRIISAGPARLAAALLVATALLAVGAGAASASKVVIYKNLPSTESFSALGFESDSVWEFGGEVEFPGTARKSPTIAVEMLSFACQEGSVETCTTSRSASFEWPITLSVYRVGSLSSPIDRITRTFKIPYRPSETAKCPNLGWTKGYGKECFTAKQTKIRFSLPGAVLPAQAIIAVAFNTETYGNEPTGEEGPYDSLNVAENTDYQCLHEDKATKECEHEEYELLPTAPSVGSDPLPEQVFLNSTYSAITCGGAEGYFGATGDCWKYDQPAFEVKAS